ETTNFINPWDFEEVYAKLFDWCQSQDFDPEQNDYLFHITTGTHVAQICIFLLTESRHFPGRLIQTSPDKHHAKHMGRAQVIDLDLSRYDQLATRFDQEHLTGKAFLKGGIETCNVKFNSLIAQIEKVAIRSSAPILLSGPTGAGKSQLASRIYQLKKRRAMVGGEFVAVNCATLRGDNAMAALFGHTKGAFTGALQAREGFLKSADQGVLFLDEIGELGIEEQAMLLHALENKSFYPVGSDKPLRSNFQLIAGTNRDLKAEVLEGRFRQDLLARINLWHYELPALRDRREDIAPNISYELRQYAEREGTRAEFNKEARDRFLQFAQSTDALWQGNFRDLNAAITRMSTLADSSRITLRDVEDEILRLKNSWSTTQVGAADLIERYLPQDAIDSLDLFDRNQLNYVLQVCEQHDSLASAGRELFQASRLEKKQVNDSSRLQKYLAKFGISTSSIKQHKH
ncbi:MAG: AAA family ATPase, partial [Gammaproteobacteria bacterium]